MELWKWYTQLKPDVSHGRVIPRGGITVGDREEILRKVRQLILLYQSGKLGGSTMPEDSNPGFARDSKENYAYFTLPMALNYQRNSYKLWEAALATQNDPETADVFDIASAARMSEPLLQEKLTRHNLALQRNKQPAVWKTLCCTFHEWYADDIRNLFEEQGRSVKKVKAHMSAHKKWFPYLSGNKIMNYWLYVIENDTDMVFADRREISVAPDTHIIQASEKLGVISSEERASSKVQETVARAWESLLAGTELCPIDVHTPMWLWSRSGFAEKVE